MPTRINRWAVFACLWSCLCGDIAPAAELTAEDARIVPDAQTALNSGPAAQTVTLLMPLRTKYPDLGDIPRLLAHAYFEQQQFAEARQASMEAISLGRMTPDVVACIAQIDRERDDTIALLGAVRLLTVLDPD